MQRHCEIRVNLEEPLFSRPCVVLKGRERVRVDVCVWRLPSETMEMVVMKEGFEVLENLKSRMNK